jgi:hypothetical protein
VIATLPATPLLLGQLSRLREVRAGQQDQELLAAEAVCEVERAQLLAQLVGDLLEHDVAYGVTSRVVDRLEVVEVADDDADGLAGQLGLLRQLEYACAERLAVEHAGQLVDDGVAAVLDVRAHEWGGEHGNTQQQRHGRDHKHRVVDDLLRVDAEGDGKEDEDVDDHADDNAAHGKT